jgi:ribonuclease HIII
MKNQDSSVITLLVDEPTIFKMEDFYKDHLLENKQPFVSFIAKYEKTTITAYKSLKVVFQGEGAFREAKIWSKTLKLDINVTKNGDLTRSHIGSDEVGTGDLFGPIIVVACYVKAEQIKELIALGVKDSKLLKDPEITIIAKKLLKLVSYSQLHLPNLKYNQLIHEGFNMNKIKAYLHNQALLNLKKKLSVKNIPIIIDQFCNETKYYEYLHHQKEVVNKILFITKAESKAVAVACASIIARYSFISKLEQLGQKYGVVIPKGAGGKVDEFAKVFVNKNGIDEFTSIAKMNFKNVERITGLDSE